MARTLLFYRGPNGEYIPVTTDTPMPVSVDNLPTGVVESVVAGTNVTVDATDPANPIVSATGGGGGGGGAPSGPAGGALAGTYPDPILAVDRVPVTADYPVDTDHVVTATVASQERFSALAKGQLRWTPADGIGGGVLYLSDPNTLSTNLGIYSTKDVHAGGDFSATGDAAIVGNVFAANLGTASAADTGTSAGNVPTIAEADARYDSTGAAAAAQAFAIQRTNHTGTQAESTVTNLVSDLAAKAADSSVVHVTGAESVAGVKNFTSTPLVPGASLAADQAAGTASPRTLGTAATQATAGNDSRLSDSRTPVTHHTTHESGGSDQLTLAESQITNLVGDLAAKIATSAIDTDGTLAANSDARLPSQKAAKTYIDQIIAAQDAMVFKGSIDCSTNPNYPAADRGHVYRVSVAGKIGGASGVAVEAGDLATCLTDGTASGNQATVGTQWTISQTNIDGAVIGPASATDADFVQFNGTSGKLIQDGGLSRDTDGTFAANSDTRIPSQKAAKTYTDTGLAAKAATTTTLTAGAGLTGGGDLSANRTLNVVANADGTMVVNADDIQVGVLVSGNVPNSLITYAKIQDEPQSTFLMRAAASGTGPPIAGTPTQAKTALAITNTDVSGLGTLATQNGTFSGTSSGTNTGDQTITLTGDMTASGSGSFVATLATVNANTGTFGDATHVGTFTVNGKGLVTAASSTVIAIPESAVTNLTSDLASKAPSVAQLKATALKSGNYTAAPGDYVPFDTTSGTPILTLPTTPADGTIVAAKRVVGGTNPVTVNAGGSDVFNVVGGGTSASMAVLNQQIIFRYASAAAIWYLETSLSLGGLDGRFAPLVHAANHASGGSDPVTLAESQVTNLVSDLALKAPLASPALTGTPTVPTAAQGTNTTQAASTAMVHSEVVLLAPLASPALTGSPTAPTQSAGDNSTKVATTAYADTGLALKANLASPTFTGTATSPLLKATGGTGTNSTPTTLTGGNPSGAPTTGTHVKGELSPDDTGKLFYCTVAGTPGTWVNVSSSAGMATDTLWNAAGDLAYASADNTGAILAYGADSKMLVGVGGLPAWRDRLGVGTPQTSKQSLTASTRTVIPGTSYQITTPLVAGVSMFRFEVMVDKTAAGTATWQAIVAFGTANSNADTAIATFTSGTNTAQANSAILVIYVPILTTGAAATAGCMAAMGQVGGGSTTGLGGFNGAPGATNTFDTTATNPWIHVDIIPGASAVMTGFGYAQVMR